MSFKTANNAFDSRNDISLYQNELALRDKEISNLKNKINNLIFNKNSLISQMDKSHKKRTIPSSKNVSPQTHNTYKKIYSSFHALQNDNSLIKDKMNLNVRIGDKYNDTYQFKLLSAQKEIENLTIMNANKDNIIMNMQTFLYNLNNIFCNGKINLNINKIDIRTFICNLKKLEEKIIKKLHIIIPKPNKIPESIIKRLKDNPIKKQNTETVLIKKKHLYIYPLNQRNNNNNSNKIYTQANINLNDNSIKKGNITCQSICTKKKIKDWRDIIDSAGRYNSLKKKKHMKDNKLRLKRLFLAKNNEINYKELSKKHLKSSDNKNNNEYLKTINNEISLSGMLLNDNIYINTNGVFSKKIIDKL